MKFALGKAFCWFLGHRWSEWIARPKGAFVYGDEERTCARCKTLETRFVFPKIAVGHTIRVKLPERWLMQGNIIVQMEPELEPEPVPPSSADVPDLTPEKPQP